MSTKEEVLIFYRSHFAAFALIPCVLIGLATSQERKNRSIDGWGKVIDPDSDCTIRAAQGAVTITVPGTHHNLNPLISSTARL
jgi:hypothetical protein